MVVGPEGGLEPDEVSQLGAVGRFAVGPHVLRAETAAVAAAVRACAHPTTLGERCPAMNGLPGRQLVPFGSLVPSSGMGALGEWWG